VVESDEPVPKLPRGRGLKLSTPELIKILLTAGMLVAVIVLAGPCSDAVSNFVMRFDNGSAKGSAARELPRPDNVKTPEHYELLRGNMTEAEQKEAIERERARAKAATQGSAAAPTLSP
jgi:hypothetical protein